MKENACYFFFKLQSFIYMKCVIFMVVVLREIPQIKCSHFTVKMELTLASF